MFRGCIFRQHEHKKHTQTANRQLHRYRLTRIRKKILLHAMPGILQTPSQRREQKNILPSDTQALYKTERQQKKQTPILERLGHIRFSCITRFSCSRYILQQQ